MTIASQQTYQQSTFNGTTTQVSFPNKIFSAFDLVVTLIDTLGNLYPFTSSGNNTFTNATTGLSYTVYNIDVDSGCYIAFSGAPTSGWIGDLRTAIAELQSTSIKNQSGFLPELHEEFFDKATRMIQDLYRKTYTFGVHGNDIETTQWPSVGTPAQRANTNLGFGPAGALQTSVALASGTLSRASIGSFLYPQSTAESNAGVIPLDTSYQVGWDQRYGAVGDGVTDDTTALSNMIKVANASKGIQLIYRGLTYGISAPLPQIVVNDVQMLGVGPDGAHNGTSTPNGTTFKWIGSSSSGTMLTVAPTSGSAQYLTGIKVLGISFDCNAGTIQNGLLVQSCRYSQFDYFVKEAGAAGATFGAVATLTSDPCDVQFNRINHRGYQSVAAGVSLVLTGTATANTSFNRFESIDVLHKNAPAVNSINSDNNWFEVVRLFHDNTGSATDCWQFQGGTSAGVCARSEQIWKLSATLRSHWIGASNFSNPPIKIFNLDKGNGSPDPVQDLPGQVFWQNDTTPVTNEAWTNYTPTPASTGTTFGTCTGQYQQDANSVTLTVNVPVTTAGTGAMTVTLPPNLPIAAGAQFTVGAGYDSNIGTELIGYINPGAATVLSIVKAGGLYPAVNGSALEVTIRYRTA